MQIGQLSLDQLTAIASPVQGLVELLQLVARAANYLEIRVELRWQLAGEPFAILLELLFVLDQPAPGVFQLRLEELIGPFGEIGPDAQGLRAEERRKPIGHLHDRARSAPHIPYAESVPL